MARAHAALARSLANSGLHDMAACLRELEPVHALAWQTRTLAYPLLRVVCQFGRPDRQGLRTDEPTVRAWLEPWWQRLRERPDAARTIRMDEALDYLRLLQSLGAAAEGEAYFAEAVQARIDRLRAQPDDALALAELNSAARSLFGGWLFQDHLRRVHAQLREGLGESHPASLRVLRALAYHERYLGRPAQALLDIERAASLTARDRPADAELNAHMATEHAACLSNVGQLAEAVEKMLLAREFFAAQQPTAWTSLTRIDYNLAGMALDMGDFDGAIRYADRSISTAQLSGVPVLLTEARVPRSTREVARLMLGQADAAPALKAVLEETGSGEMHIGSQAFALAQFAAQAGDEALFAWAADFTARHVKLFRAPLQADQALPPLMRAWQQGGVPLHSNEVRGDLDQANVIALSGRSLNTMALAHFNLARHLRPRDVEASAWLYKRGANALLTLSAGLPEGQSDSYRAWLGTYEGDLRALIELLIDQGRLPEAEQALRRLRDEEVYEFTRRAPKRDAALATISYTRLEQQGNDWIGSLGQRVEASARAADARLDKRGSGALRDSYTDAVADAELAAMQKEFHQGVAAQFAHAGAPSAAAEITTAALGAGQARLTYFVAADGLTVLVQTRHAHRSVRVPVERAALFRLVERARAALGTPALDAQAPLRALHAQLIAPVLPWLRAAQVKRLLIVPDSALRYLPFAALFDGRHYLGQDYEVSNQWAKPNVPDTPSAATGLLGLGRSLGDAQHGALPGVVLELAALRRVGGTVLQDAAFSLASLEAGLRQRPRIVHIASHFTLDPAGEDKSTLLLGDGQALSLAKLKLLPWSGVALALLSACDSAVSVDQGQGRELTGFANALQSAGVRNVIATLWRIDDAASARWATLFYAPLARPQGSARVPDPSWLAATQRQWLRAHAGTALAHPHYWAAFTWLGDGR